MTNQEFKNYCIKNGIINPKVYETDNAFFADASWNDGNVMKSDILGKFHHVKDYKTVTGIFGYTLKLFKDKRKGNGSFGWEI